MGISFRFSVYKERHVPSNSVRTKVKKDSLFGLGWEWDSKPYRVVRSGGMRKGHPRRAQRQKEKVDKSLLARHPNS
jgi:hypothetical protein